MAAVIGRIRALRPPQQRAPRSSTCLAAAAVWQPPAPPALSPGEVHLWWLPPAAASCDLLLAQCQQLLPPSEAPPEGTPAPAARERTLSRALQRAVLSRYARAPPGALMIARGPFGKPRAAPYARGLDLRHSVAHSAGGLILAVALGAEVGVDLEASARVPRRGVARLAARYFAPAEVEGLSAAPEGAPRAALFTATWALKEAYIKALGRGIAGTPLSSFAATLQPRVAPGAPLTADLALLPPAEAHTEAAPPWGPLSEPWEEHRPGPTAAASSTPADAPWVLSLLALGPSHLGALCARPGKCGGTPALRVWQMESLDRECELPLQLPTHHFGEAGWCAAAVLAASLEAASASAQTSGDHNHFAAILALGRISGNEKITIVRS